MEDAILNTISFLENVDFAVVFKGLGVGLILFWIVVIGWVVFDASDRYPTVWPRILSLILVVVFPLFGLLVYLIIRPKTTMEEAVWLDLERRYLKYETAGLSDCPSCGYELMPSFVYCPNCGDEIRFKCGSCEVYLEEDWHSCPFCGEAQTHSSAERSPKRREAKYSNSKKSKKKKESRLSQWRKKDKEKGSNETSKHAHKSKEDHGTKAKEPPVASGSVGSPKRKLKGTERVRYQAGRAMKGMDSFVQKVGSLPLRLIRKEDTDKDSSK